MPSVAVTGGQLIAVHIINRFENATGGSELRALNLAKVLSDSTPVQLWSTADVAVGLPSKLIKRIKTTRLRFPRGGTMVFVGAYFRPGNWLRMAFPDRVIIVYNTPNPDRLQALIGQVRRFCRVEPEVRFASQTMQGSVDVPGSVEISLFDLQAFRPHGKQPEDRFVVGRMSRDEEIKHHHEDAGLYKDLLKAGVHVRIMGPSPRLREQLQGLEGVELLKCGDEAAPDFLRSLDCFFYRTNTCWSEPWGRVVAEAMATGLPVVGHSSGGYRALIESGENGFIFDETDEARQIILGLRADARRRDEIGVSARETILASHGRAVQDRLVESYV